MRGRQYYDPIIQVPGKVEGIPDMSRIELYPEGTADDPSPKWRGRLINPDGSIAAIAPGDFDRNRASVQAQQMWPGLTVYELREEGQDTTWEGHGPSPRLWQKASEMGLPPIVDPPLMDNGDSVMGGPEPGFDDPAFKQNAEQIPLRLIHIIQPGSYVLLTDICALLEMWAKDFDESKNPSGAMALREALETLKEIG